MCYGIMDTTVFCEKVTFYFQNLGHIDPFRSENIDYNLLFRTVLNIIKFHNK